MKKKISVLLIGSLLAISLAGCSNSNSTASTPSDESSVDISAQDSIQTTESDENNLSSNTSSDLTTEDSENSVSEESQNSVSAEESEIIGPEDGDIVLTEDGSEIILHEDDIGNNIVIDPDEEDSMEVTSDGSEALPKYLDVTFTPINGNDKNINANAIDMSNPVYYTIAGTDEMKNFVSQYDKTYSLNDVESGVTFDTLTEKFDDSYFEYMSLIVIPVKYDKDTEPEIGEITVSGNNYNIQVCAVPPASEAQTDCLCFVIQANKSELGNNNIVLTVVEDNIIIDGEEEI